MLQISVKSQKSFSIHLSKYMPNRSGAAEAQWSVLLCCNRDAAGSNPSCVRNGVQSGRCLACEFAHCGDTCRRQ